MDSLIPKDARLTLRRKAVRFGCPIGSLSGSRVYMLGNDSKGVVLNGLIENRETVGNSDVHFARHFRCTKTRTVPGLGDWRSGRC